MKRTLLALAAAALAAGGAGVANDACAGAIALTAETPVTGDTTNAVTDITFDQSGTCTAVFGWVNELVYSFTATTAAKYSITVTPGTGSNLDASLVVLDSCSTTVSACVGGSDVGFNGDPE